MEDKEDLRVRVQGLNLRVEGLNTSTRTRSKGYIIMTCWSTTPDLGLAGMDASDTPLALPSDIPLPPGTLPTAHQAFNLLLTIHHTPYRPPATHSKVELKKTALTGRILGVLRVRYSTPQDCKHRRFTAKYEYLGNLKNISSVGFGGQYQTGLIFRISG